MALLRSLNLTVEWNGMWLVAWRFLCWWVGLWRLSGEEGASRPGLYIVASARPGQCTRSEHLHLAVHRDCLAWVD
jgi:hypothetical protein